MSIYDEVWVSPRVVYIYSCLVLFVYINARTQDCGSIHHCNDAFVHYVFTYLLISIMSSEGRWH